MGDEGDYIDVDVFDGVCHDSRDRAPPARVADCGATYP
jgi:hypothetical protein